MLYCYIEIQEIKYEKLNIKYEKLWEGLTKVSIYFECCLQIIIEGVRGSSYVSDIAIDDIAILQGDECIVKNESTSVTVGDDGKFIF